jgi:hypothetical protein
MSAKFQINFQWIRKRKSKYKNVKTPEAKAAIEENVNFRI